MSQASRRHALAPIRHRRGIARSLAPFATGLLHDECPDCMGEGMERGGTFDVHAAREHALGLVALGDTQTVFEDWTRERGRGPDNRDPGAFQIDIWAYARPDFVGNFKSGGWVVAPGSVEIAGREWHPASTPADAGGWPGNLAQQWPGDSRAPMGRSYARRGRRLLAALEGQPSECRACSKGSRPSPLGTGHMVECQRCRGTGHNLRGVIPALEWSPAVRRKVVDAEIARGQSNQRRDCWTFPILDTLTEPEVSIRVGPRSCPRGEHRHLGTRDGEHDLDRRISERLWDTWGDEHKPGFDARPRWRRGEIKHARQRAARADGSDQPQ